ncbi:MAG: hypothetical protein LH466_08950 [Sphingomonas bacterium]|nr:hypothetical protein [Sphingomonas bacterium]
MRNLGAAPRSPHLAILARAGLVSSDWQGRSLITLALMGKSSGRYEDLGGVTIN